MNKEKDTKHDAEKMIMLANFIFEQNKMQQESKEVWFGHYLSILAGVAALSTICLTVFDKVKIEVLYLITGSAFLFTGICGFIFFRIFLCQRANYWKNYKLLNELQIYLIEETLNKEYTYFYAQKEPYAKRKHGADFYAMIIEDIMVSICFGIATVFFMLSIGCNESVIIGVTAMIFGVVAILLFLIYIKFERNNRI